jgi:HEAT repeat protein
MKWFIMSLFCLGGAFVVFQMQQAELHKTEKEFQTKIAEVNNHVFTVPAIPEADPSRALTEQELKKYHRALKSANFGTRMEAINRLWDAQDQAVVPAIKHIILKKYVVCYGQCENIPAQKMQVLDMLKRSQSQLNMEFLIMAAGDRNKDVRLSAVQGLGAYVTSDVLEPLQIASSDKNKEIAATANESFNRIIESMDNWKSDRRKALIEEYAAKIAVGDYKEAEKKLQAMADTISKNSAAASSAH